MKFSICRIVWSHNVCIASWLAQATCGVTMTLGRSRMPSSGLSGFGGSVLYCGIGLVVFMLLTAYDTQKLQQMYSYYSADAEMAEKASIYGALTLYLDFINIFLYVVRLMGNNRRRS